MDSATSQTAATLDENASGDRPNPRAIATQVDFARALRVLRAQSGLSVRDVASLLAGRSKHAVPASTLSGWFTGSHLPTLKLVQANVVADLLQVCGESDPVEIKEWLAALQRVRRAPGPRPASSMSPFRGLAPYEVEHAAYFCGRDELLAQLQGMLDRQRGGGQPVMVVGPSGSGKSSLLRAGLIPRFSHGASPSPDQLSPFVLMTPGPHPVQELASRLAGLVGQAGDAWRRRLLDDPTSCTEFVTSASDADGPLLIVVDQFEELFTLCDDEGERLVFVEALCTACAAGAALVVLGMRADFYPQALRIPGLVSVLQESQILVGPMSREQLREAITGPARVAGLNLEPGLVELLLSEVSTTHARTAGETAYEVGSCRCCLTRS